MARSDPFEDILPFVLTAEAKSFGTAAKRLGVSPSSVSRSVAKLEADLGVKLLNRSSRSVELSSEGAIFLDRCIDILEKMDQARSLMTAARAEPSGVLRVSMPIAFGNAVILPKLEKFLSDHPLVRLQVSLTDRWVDLVQEGFDLAIRVGPLPDSGLIAKKVSSSNFVTVAAPRYLSAFGTPKHPQELVKHRCLKFLMSSGVERPWRFQIPSAKSYQIDVPGYLTIDNGEALLRAAAQGLGIAYLPDYLGSGPIKFVASCRMC